MIVGGGREGERTSLRFFIYETKGRGGTAQRDNNISDMYAVYFLEAGGGRAGQVARGMGWFSQCFLLCIFRTVIINKVDIYVDNIAVPPIIIDVRVTVPIDRTKKRHSF